jgi:acyl-CoA ligase (AMP-forming) (exosortase A-associated)
VTKPDPAPYPIDHVLRGKPDDVALVLKDRALTFAEVERDVAALAGWLRAEVAEPGARVASWAAKGWLTSLLPLAAPRVGLVHVPINPLLKRAQAAHILSDSGASMLIGTPARLATLDAGEVPDGCRLEEEGGSFSGEPLGPSGAAPDSLATILYTSGSTGLPKGVMLSHANLWLGAVSVAHYLAMASDDVTLAVLPFAFDYGQNQLFSTWIAGGSVVPLDYLLPRDVVKACARHDVTTLAAVPPLWWQLVETDWPADATASMRRLTNSGGALSVELVERLRANFPTSKLYPMYGLTEAFRSTFLDPTLVETHPTSMGRAIPFAEILVVREDGRLADDGEEGELVHCGPLVAQGYWRDPKRTAERFRPAPSASRFGETAVWSGDRVRRDADGLLHFVARRDAMIKSAGNRISPQEVEDAALATGLASEAAALGVPDERLGQAVELVVRGREANGEALKTALAKVLPGFMQPRRIHWRQAMPLGPNGKIDRVALAQEIAR